MADITYFVALPFLMSDDGPAPGEAAACTSANAAIMRAESLSRKEGVVVALAFSRNGDPMLGEFSDAVLLCAFGEVPADLSGL